MREGDTRERNKIQKTAPNDGVTSLLAERQEVRNISDFDRDDHR